VQNENGKAAGLDSLTCEHLKYSHPIVITLLTKLFNLFIATGHIPNEFGVSYTVPIPKVDGLTRSVTVDDFRGISISPVISKLFELCILDRFSDYFKSSDFQFGFKQRLSCSHAIYSVRNVIDHFVSNGSTVNACTLDLSKAFDRMNHYALLTKLMDRKLPCELLDIFEYWFTISVTCIKWYGCVSTFFKLTAGVRQGGVLSPVLFAIFIDCLALKVKAANLGCYLSTNCACIFLYADDIMLLAPTVSGLQSLLNVCVAELADIDMSLNAKKCYCIRFGPRFDAPCTRLLIGDDVVLPWVSSCKYLGIYFVSGRVLRCSFDISKRKFFRSFNAVYSKVGRRASEEVILSLIRSKCLPLLLYATEACPLFSRDRQSLEFTCTRIFMKIFRTGSSQIVKDCQTFLNFKSINDQITNRICKFLAKYEICENTICSLFSRVARRQLDLIQHL